jgi:hypothetical protein
VGLLTVNPFPHLGVGHVRDSYFDDGASTEAFDDVPRGTLVFVGSRLHSFEARIEQESHQFIVFKWGYSLHICEGSFYNLSVSSAPESGEEYQVGHCGGKN